MKKQTLAMLLSATMLITLAGCGSQKISPVAGLNLSDYVTLGQYEGVEVNLNGAYDVTNVSDEAVDEYILTQLNEGSIYEKDDSQTVVQENSIVNVDYVGKLDGEAFSGGSASDVNLDVAGNCDADSGSAFIDGFTAGLPGTEVGQSVDCPVTFPKNYGSEDLAGKEVVFTFKVNYICKLAESDVELTDDYVKENFGYDTVDEYRDYVRDYLKDQYATARESAIRGLVMDQVVSNATVKDIPQDVLDSTVSDSLSDELVFMAVADAAGIEIDEDGYNDYVNSLLSRYGFDDASDFYDYYSTDEESGEDYVRRIYLCNKAIDYCVEKADVID